MYRRPRAAVLSTALKNVNRLKLHAAGPTRQPGGSSGPAARSGEATAGRPTTQATRARQRRPCHPTRTRLMVTTMVWTAPRRPPQRLLAVQVLAGSERPGGDDPVPVVGDRDDQSVDVFAVNHLAEVVVGLATAVRPAIVPLGVEPFDPLPGFLQAGPAEVADGNNLAEGRPHHAHHVVRAAVPGADHPHRDPLAGRGWSGSGVSGDEPERLPKDGYNLGSTGSHSRARTPKTHSWTRRSGSPRTNRSSPSMPRANSPRASVLLRPSPRDRRRSRFSPDV